LAAVHWPCRDGKKKTESNHYLEFLTDYK
jgi:hypothetical protein